MRLRPQVRGVSGSAVPTSTGYRRLLPAGSPSAGAGTVSAAGRTWRNLVRRSGLKSRRPKGHVGSNPTVRTVRSAAEVRAVLAFSATGASDSEIARRTGIPRRTVADWTAAGESRLTPRERRRPRPDVANVPA